MARWQIEDFEFDSARGRLRRGRAVASEGVGNQEAKVLTFLLDNQGRDYDNEELIAKAWNGIPVTSHSLYKVICNLRQLLGGDRNDFIKNRPYRLAVDAVRVTENDSASLDSDFREQTNHAAGTDAIQIERITSVKQRATLMLALALYGKRLPENECDSEEEIIRWVKEIEAETKAGNCSLKDYFLIAKIGDQVEGMLYAQYYPDRGLAFLSYLVIEESSEAHNLRASARLLDYLLTELRAEKCTGIVFELEFSKTGKLAHRRECRSRMRRFRWLSRLLGVIVKEVVIPYRQPKLSLWEQGRQEERQHLMYGRLDSPELNDAIRKPEARNILGFLYEDIYGDGFEYDANRDSRFRGYLRRQLKAVADRLPGIVRLS